MAIPFITQLPEAPQRSDARPDFALRADVFFAAIDPMRYQMNQMAAWMNDQRDDIYSYSDNVEAWMNATLAARNAAQAAATNAAASESAAKDHLDDTAALIAAFDPTGDPLPEVTSVNAPLVVATPQGGVKFSRRALNNGAGVRPALRFDFANQGYLDPRITFTRASKDWGFDAEGNYREFDINQPVFDHDPLTGESLGVRVWPQRRYLLPHSSSFVGWTMIGGSIIEENVFINSYGDSFFKLFSSQDESPIIRRDYTFGLHEQEVSLIARSASLSCVMFRIVAGADIRVTVNLSTLDISVSNINVNAVKVRRLIGDDVEIRIVYTPTTPSGRFDIWAKRYLDTSVGSSDIVAGEHIYISSCSVCDQIGAPYVRTGESQITVSSQYMSTDLNLGTGIGTYVVSLLDCGQTTSHAGPLHIKRTYSDIYGAAIRLRTRPNNYLPAVGGSAILRGNSDSTKGSIDKETLEKKAGISILPDGAAFFSMGGEGVPIGAMPLTDLGRISLGEVRISGSGERTMRGYIKSMSYYPRPLDLEKLKESTTL